MYIYSFIQTAYLVLFPTVRHSKPRTTSHCQTQQTSSCTPLSDSKSRPLPHCQTQQTSHHVSLSDTANLALCPTVRQSRPHLCPTVRHSKYRLVPHCLAQQTLHHAPVSDTANLAPCPIVRNSKPRTTTNLALCPNVRHSKPHLVPHCQEQQISHHVHCQTQRTPPCAPLTDTANLTLCPTVRHNQPRPTPHCHVQQTSPCAALSVLMREFIRRMRSSGTAWQVCYASHSLFNSQLTTVKSFQTDSELAAAAITRFP